METHIFHTNNERVAKFVNNHGLNTKFEHKVLTKLMIMESTVVFGIQIDELKTKQWKKSELIITMNMLCQ